MTIIAHRGESFLAPENTLAAINMAWAKGSLAVEVDVQLTQDKEIVVIHDRNTKRVGDKNMKVRRSLLQDLRTVDVGFFKGDEWKGERIPCLSAVLDTVPENGKLIIEIKCGKEVVPILAAEIASSGLRFDQIEIISFNYKVLKETKKYLPDYKMLWLLDLDYFWPAWMKTPNIKSLHKRISKAGFDGVNVWAGKLLNRDFIQSLKKNKLLVYSWTVNDTAKAKELISTGIDAITTDRPEWLLKQISEDSQ